MLRGPSVPYVLPFVVFLIFLAVQGKLGIPEEWEFPLRVVLLAAVLWIFSRKVLDFRVRHWAGSIAIGAAVFVIWIGPDLLSPSYREHWLFRNSLTNTTVDLGAGYSTLHWSTLGFRTFRAVVLVPIIEELFWRAWLMRWLIKPDFQSLPLGVYSASSFWITAALFGAEHGPYWDVGLITGVIYNWWMVRTKSLGDLILTHAVTNGILSGYVLATAKWQYW